MLIFWGKGRKRKHLHALQTYLFRERKHHLEWKMFPQKKMECRATIEGKLSSLENILVCIKLQKKKKRRKDQLMGRMENDVNSVFMNIIFLLSFPFCKWLTRATKKKEGKKNLPVSKNSWMVLVLLSSRFRWSFCWRKKKMKWNPRTEGIIFTMAITFLIVVLILFTMGYYIILKSRFMRPQFLRCWLNRNIRYVLSQIYFTKEEEMNKLISYFFSLFFFFRCLVDIVEAYNTP